MPFSIACFWTGKVRKRLRSIAAELRHQRAGRQLHGSSALTRATTSPGGDRRAFDDVEAVQLSLSMGADSSRCRLRPQLALGFDDHAHLPRTATRPNIASSKVASKAIADANRARFDGANLIL